MTSGPTLEMIKQALSAQKVRCELGLTWTDGKTIRLNVRPDLLLWIIDKPGIEPVEGIEQRGPSHRMGDFSDVDEPTR